MRGVMFGNKHSFHNWGLMLKSRPVISPPTPKTNYVDVPGADGSIDLTDALTGYTLYKNRKITFEFSVMAGRAEWPAIYSELMDTLHGNTVEIVFDDDPMYYYKGRVTVGKWDAENVMTATLTMSAEVEPYKTARYSEPGYKNLTVEGSRTVTVSGTRKPSVPAFTVSADMQVSFMGNTYMLTAGENTLPEIVIRQGKNLLEFTGNGTVSIDYRGGAILMYIIKVDGKLMYSPELMDDGYKVISPKMHLEVNTAGSLDFTLPPCNVKYADIRKMKSIVTVEQDGEQVFRGRVLEENMDIYRLKEMYCEGDLSFFLDSLIAPISFEGTAAQFFSALVSAHNLQMEEDKQFVVGDLSGLDNEKIIKIATTTYADTLDTIKALLLDVYGGFIRTRFADGVYYVDYISEYTHECTQKIKFGVNLLDIDSHIDTAELCTVLVPLGASTDDGTALTIAEVNEGSIFIENAELIARYGRIYRTYTWDQVTDPAQLMELGQKYMQDNVLSETLTLKAVDMHLTNKNIEKIRLGDKVQLESPAHGIERVSVCAAQDIDLQNGDQSEYTFGLPKQTMADQAVSTAEQLDKVKNSINDQHRWLTETQTALNISVNAINLIGHRTTQLEIDVDAAEAAITMKASQDDVDILGERHTAVELRLDAAEDSITAKADKVKVEALETEIAGLLKADELETAIANIGDLHVGGDVNVPGSITSDSLWVNGTATLDGGIVTDTVDAVGVDTSSLTVDGSATSWKGSTVVTGIGTVNQSKRYLNIMLADGSTAQLDIVTNVSITPSTSYINYLGKN